jgi:hypothetical protein
MKALLGLLLSATSLYAGAEIYQAVAPAASEHTAELQGQLLADAAYLNAELGMPWPAALRDAVTTARHDNNLTITGTTIRWDNGVDVWCIDLPEPMSQVNPERCD